MNYSFEYIDIILLAMIAGFIFLRLRGIFLEKTGHEEDMARVLHMILILKNRWSKKKFMNLMMMQKKNF